MKETIYGTFNDAQMDDLIKRLHSKVHRLLIYKDPKITDDYSDVDYDKYYQFLMKEMDACNIIFRYPLAIVEVITLLQMAYNETKKEDFDFKAYRKFILNAQNYLDEIGKCKEGA